MAMIKCPECGKEISDKAEMCVNCGCPMSAIQEELKRIEEENNRPKFIKCDSCGHENPLDEDYCVECGNRLTPYVEKKKQSLREWLNTPCDESIKPKADNSPGLFESLSNMMTEKQEYNGKMCPKCLSRNTSPMARMKTSLNLNPLKPFTLVDHKATKKVDWVCNECGKVFR